MSMIGAALGVSFSTEYTRPSRSQTNMRPLGPNLMPAASFQLVPISSSAKPAVSVAATASGTPGPAASSAMSAPASALRMVDAFIAGSTSTYLDRPDCARTAG